MIFLQLFFCSSSSFSLGGTDHLQTETRLSQWSNSSDPIQRDHFPLLNQMLVPFFAHTYRVFFSSRAYSFLPMAPSFPFIKCKYKTNSFSKDLNTPSTLNQLFPRQKKTQTLLDYICWHYPLSFSRIFPAPSCYSSAFLILSALSPEFSLKL